MTEESPVHPPLDRPAAEDLVGRWLSDETAVTVAVELDGRLIGDVRLMVRPAATKAPAVTEEAEGWLGYAVHPRAQGRGLATEAVGRPGAVPAAHGPCRRSG